MTMNSVLEDTVRFPLGAVDCLKESHTRMNNCHRMLQWEIMMQSFCSAKALGCGHCREKNRAEVSTATAQREKAMPSREKYFLFKTTASIWGEENSRYFEDFSLRCSKLYLAGHIVTRTTCWDDANLSYLEEAHLSFHQLAKGEQAECL
jgi:hypothetical protein